MACSAAMALFVLAVPGGRASHVPERDELHLDVGDVRLAGAVLGEGERLEPERRHDGEVVERRLLGGVERRDEDGGHVPGRIVSPIGDGSPIECAQTFDDHPRRVYVLHQLNLTQSTHMSSVAVVFPGHTATPQ